MVHVPVCNLFLLMPISDEIVDDFDAQVSRHPFLCICMHMCIIIIVINFLKVIINFYF